MRFFKKFTVIAVAASMILGLASCGGSSEDEGDTLRVAYQYGMAYAPFEVMKEQKLIEKYYDGITVEYQTLNSGSVINEGVVSGDIDIGAMGLAPAITGVMAGVPYKIASNVSAQPHKIMTNEKKIKSLSDIKDEKIALVNIGSIQHILLAMAADRELGDAHALDNNIVAMSHPDGMSSLISGSVECQLTTSPYVFKEEQEKGIYEVEGLSEVWPAGNTFIVMVAANELYEKDPELYQAVVLALDEAITWINENKEEAAEMLCAAEGVDAETMLSWLNDPACVYSTETKGAMTMANFMAENDFLEDEGPSSYSDLVFDNVKGN